MKFDHKSGNSYGSASGRWGRPWLGILFLVLACCGQTAQAACPGVDGSVSGSQQVIFEACTEYKDTNGGTGTIASPAGTGVGDLLVLAVAADGTPVVTPPAGWSQVNYGNDGGDVTLGIWTRRAAVAGAFNYNFDVNANEEVYAWLMQFSGGAGVDPSEVAVLTGNNGFGSPADSPAVTTTVADSLIVRAGGFDDDDITVDPVTIVNGHTNITQDESGTGGGTVSGAAAYVNQAVPGSSGTAVFDSAPGGFFEQWRTVTFAIRPSVPAFRIIHDGLASTCAVENITIAAYNGDGTINTGYTGTISISTSTASGFWAAGTSNGTLVPGAGNGTASYTFAPADNGSVTLEFQHTGAGAVNFNVTDGSIAEDSFFDADLQVSDCAFPSPFFTEVQCSANTNTESINIVSQASNPNRIVLLAIGTEGNPTFPTSANFDVGGSNAPMTLVARAYLDDGSFDMLTEIWAILDSDLPAAAGFYTATHTGGGGDASICLLAAVDMEQVVPQPGTPNPSTFPVNINAIDSPGNAAITTSITTQAADALVLSAVTNGEVSSYPATSLAERLWDLTAGGQTTFAGSAEVIPAAGPVAVTETAAAAPNRVSHVVAAFSPAPPPPPVIDHFRIIHNNSGGECVANPVTIRAINSLGVVDTGYTGTITITTSTFDGDWSLAAGNGVLTPGPGDGTATYQFAPADNGEVVLDFSHPAATVNFNVTDGSVSESFIFDNDMIIGACGFQFSHSGIGGVCSEEAVTVRAIDSAGNVLVNYSGGITLSTSTGNGTWTLNTGGGSFLDATAGDGAATYTFDSGDQGEVVLNFHDPNAGPVNFNVSDGTYADLPGFDPDLAIGSCEFRISHSGIGDVCSVQPVTFSAVSTDGDAGIHYSGTVNLSTSTGNGTWSVGGGAGILVGGPADGTASYTFDPGDSGSVELDFLDISIETVNFNITDGSGSEDPGFDPDMTLSSCAPSTGDLQCSIAASDTLSIVSQAENANRMVLMFVSGEGTQVVTDAEFNNVDMTLIRREVHNQGLGNVNEVWGILDADLPAGAGSYTGTYTGAPAGSAICLLALTDVQQDFPAAPAVNGSQTGNVQTIATSITVPVDSSLVLSAPANGGSGTYATTTLDTRLWNVNPSSAVYSGSAGVRDAGPLTVTETASTGVTNRQTHIVASFAPYTRPMSGFRISHGGTGSACTPNTVTITAIDILGNTIEDYTGNVILSTSTAKGNWSGAGLGVLNNGTSNDGIASYSFVAGDQGQASFSLSHTTTGSVNIDVTDGTFSESPFFDPSLNVGACAFRISHSGSADVCTLETVTITAVDALGNTRTGYSGTINLSTSTAHGTWTLNAGSGSFSDPFQDDGSASYTFNPADNGVLVLNLRDVHPETLNINVTDGSAVEAPGFDPNLTVGNCSFRFSHSGGMTACSAATVTLAVYDSGGAAATGFTGTVDLSTSLGHGSWDSTTGAGTLTDVNPGDGVASYSFVAGDNGSVSFVFSNEVAEDMTFNAGFNGSVEDPLFDPEMQVTQCLPIVSDVACYQSQSQLNAVTLPSSSATDGSRMVLMYIDSESLTPATGATIEGVPMTLLRTEIANFGAGNTLQVYGMLDADLPAAAGAVDAAFTGSANLPAMCLVAVESVEQSFPQPDMGNPPGGQINGSNAQNTQVASTSITTVDNNALVISAVGSGADGTTYSSSLTNPLWGGGDPQPNSAVFYGNYDVQPVTGTITVNETNSSGTPNRHAHIVLALPPVVPGPPFVTDYVPVTLFQTYSGNVSYRAIGSTLRNLPNTSNANSCSFVPVNTGTTSTLNLPAGSSVEAAYLYWAGSGDPGDVDDLVSFGPDGNQTVLTADEVFLIDSPAGNPTNYFAAWKDVTGLVGNGVSTTYRFSGLTVQTNSPWFPVQGCLGGWALVVVYQNLLENLNVVNLFHGFQPFQFSTFTLTPGNFRMASPDGINIPNGQMSHISFEGDNTLNEPGELFELQDTPGSLSFTPVVNSFNPLNAQFNDTISYPVYDVNLDWVPTGGPNMDGYVAQSTTSYGTDVDTYYFQGANMGEILYDFGLQEAEQITTRFGSGQDLVMLVGEVVSISNAPIADLEVFLSESGSFKVGSTGTGSFEYEVRNNGNGAVSGGFADGDVILTGNLPTGMTINSVNAPGWDCTLATSTAFTCVFEIALDWTSGLGAAVDGELAAGESLPLVEVDVNVGDETFYPLISNDVTQVARLSHVGDYTTCDAAAAGVQPDPTVCSKSPQFDNVNDLDSNQIDIDDLDDKSGANNNVVSRDTTVPGIVTDLRIVKQLAGVLEENQPAQYQLTVTNLGPDATTKTMTVTDTLPAGLAPLSATGTDWSCGIVGQDVTCTRSVSLGIGASSIITLNTGNVVAPAVEGVFVSNTAVVTPGQYNFDLVGGNNSSTVITEVVGEPVAAQDKFLLSVSELASIGGLGPFANNDLVIYDPVTDTATMFLDVSTLANTSMGDLNAVHLMPNGHIVLSAASDGNTIAGTAFDEGDLVLYDPVLEQATLIFDGSTIFTGAADVDAVFVRHNGSFDPNDWDILFSTVDDSVIDAVTYDDNDVVAWDVSAGTASLLLDGASAAVFNGDNGDIDALFVRQSDPNIYVFSTDDASVTIAVSGTQETYGRDDLVEYDSMAVEAANVFLGDVPFGVFSPASATRRLDAVHVIEDAYFGHFAITHLGSGDTCTATSITIRKHVGLSHVVDTGYEGSIRISTDIGEGIWAKDASANGTITDLGNGEAVYTFAAADAGQVILYLTQTNAATLNVDVSNGIRGENVNEDGNITINEEVTVVTYLDQFSAISYGNNDGFASFSSDWSEENDDGSPATGKAQVNGGRLRFNNLGGGQPGVLRGIDFSAYTVSDPPVLSFNWERGAVSPTDSFVVEARGSDSDPWTQLQNFTGVSGTGSGSAQFSLTEAPYNLTLGATTQIRFRVNAGFSANSSLYFYVDNVQLTTETNDCDVGDTLHHYAISHSGSLVSCLAENITITPHSLSEVVAEPGAAVTITLNTSTGRGTWSPPLNGSGAFSAVPGSGQATYTFLPGETAITFPFNYTDPETDPALVGFSVSDNNVPPKIQLEAPTLSVASAGLRFYNDTTGNEIFPTLVAGMNSDLYTAQILTVQAVQVSDDNPAVCEDIFGPGQNVTVELAFECIDPLSCSAAAIPMSVTNNSITTPVEPADSNSGAGANPGGYQPVTLRFQTFLNGDYDQGGGDFSYTAAPLVLNYADAGALQIHGRYNIPLGGDPLGGSGFSGDYLVGSGDNNFVVRPFGYDIDFGLDRQTNGHDSDADSWAEDENGSAFFTAGTGFDTTLRAVSWQAADDDGLVGGNPVGIANDGVPDSGSDLFDNASTPNYGNETNGVENDVTITHGLVAPGGGQPGILSDGAFVNFGGGGTETHTLTFSEVGIIDLTASLDSGSYLGSGQAVTGSVLNVGRFFPADFEVDNTMLVARPLLTPSASPFTYMGEEFEVQFRLTARNALGATTQNYAGGFAKLADPGGLSFFAVDDLAGGQNDIDYSPRLGVSAGNGFPAAFGPDWTDGQLSLSGNLIFSRQSSGAEDGPLEDLRIAFTALDGDGVEDVGRNVDDDDGTSEDTAFLYNLLGQHEFRYGRLRLENAYGSEIPELDALNVPIGEDLELRLVAEYWDGSRYIVNSDDVATPYSSDALDFVAGSYTDNLAPGQAVIQAGIAGVLFEGRNEDEETDDVPLYLQAPGEGFDGTVVVELDLTPLNLDFLQYDWRMPPQLEDGDQDGVYTDNPRALIEFGEFRGNDRIINWQEIIE